MILGDYILLGEFKLGYEVLNDYGVDEKLQNADMMNASSCMKDMNSEQRL